MDFSPSIPDKPKIIGITDISVIYSDGTTAKISYKTPIPVPDKPYSKAPTDSSIISNESKKPFSL